MTGYAGVSSWPNQVCRMFASPSRPSSLSGKKPDQPITFFLARCKSDSGDRTVSTSQLHSWPALSVARPAQEPRKSPCVAELYAFQRRSLCTAEPKPVYMRASIVLPASASRAVRSCRPARGLSSGDYQPSAHICSRRTIKRTLTSYPNPGWSASTCRETPDPWICPAELDRGRFETITQPKTECFA